MVAGDVAEGLQMKSDKKLLDGLDRFQKSVARVMSEEKTPLGRVVAASRELRQLIEQEALDADESELDLLEELELVLEEANTSEDARQRLADRLGSLETELREVIYQKELLAKNFQNASQENLTLSERSRKLEDMLRHTKEEIQKLREEVQKLKSPPLPYGVFVSRSPTEGMGIVNVDGKIYEVNVADDDVDLEKLVAGQTLLLNAALNIIGVRDWRKVGEVAKVVEILGDDRYVVKSRESDERVVRRAHSLIDVKIKTGESVMLDASTDLIYEVLPQSHVEEAVLEEVPTVTYDDVGGLEDQLEAIKDAVELPYIYGHLFKQFQLKPPKGILLYGPPGCGKTLIAKAVAHSLSLRIRDFLQEGREALDLLELVSDPTTDIRDLLPRYDQLKSKIFQHREIYLRKMKASEEVDALYHSLDKSGIIGDFIRRTMGQHEEPTLSCAIGDWLDLRMEIKEKGFGDLDPVRIGDMLERKKKSYFLKRKEVSDRDYIHKWLRDYLLDTNVDPDNLVSERKRIDERLSGGVESYFLNIKGPELLNKYVGETEFRIREVFIKARDKAAYGLPVIVFFDEMESMFRTRGSGVSSDIESTIVPQFLTEIDGVEALRNVIVIGASNRQDLIDPAVLRPGRLDIKIRIDRPDQAAAKDIFSKYLVPDLPLDEAELKEAGGDRVKLVRSFINDAVEEMYSTREQNRFLKVVYQSREEEILYFKDFASGAMCEGIVSRAKTGALKRMILTGKRGLRRQDLLDAIRGEYKENEDLPNTTNPDDWSKISGRKGERIISVESLLPENVKKPKKEVDEVSVSSRYL